MMDEDVVLFQELLKKSMNEKKQQTYIAFAFAMAALVWEPHTLHEYA